MGVPRIGAAILIITVVAILSQDRPVGYRR
jgi:hypothetical protein